MEELIAIILQCVIEVLFEALFYLPFEWLGTRNEQVARDSIAARCVAWTVFGGLVGGLSLLVVNHSLLPYAGLRIANLIVAPLLAGAIGKKFAQFRQRHEPSVEPREHYWFAFWFSLAITAVRFVYTSKF